MKIFNSVLLIRLLDKTKDEILSSTQLKFNQHATHATSYLRIVLSTSLQF